MSTILYFALICSSTAFILKDNRTNENLISYPHFDDSLSIFEDDVAAADCACENGRCVRDNRGKWKCLCKPRYALIGESKCAECDCGNNGKCFFNEKQVSNLGSQYEKKCLCDQAFAEKDGKCISCVCGKNSKCEFEGDEKICYCMEGFAELHGACEECNCGEGGICEFKDEKKHCTCFEGFLLNGETCEECDCGDKGTCSFVNGVRTCKCEENYLENFGICEECYCGEDSTGCEFDADGNKQCACKPNYAQNGEGRCVACNCGEQSTGCSFLDDGTKQCQCNENHAQNNGGQCEKCMCGDATVSCLFGKDNQKLCTCQPGYAVKDDGLCTVTCNDKSDCFHGSSCEGGEAAKFCDCKKGLGGPKCEIITDCVNLGKYENCKGENGTCVYDEENERAKCVCSNGKLLHPINNICQDCNCGDKSTSCVFNSGGAKECGCESNYAQNNAGVCAECTCGDRTKGCKFGPGDQKQCVCEEGYAVNDDGVCTETCSEDKICEHGGNCKNGIEDKFCYCKKGTSGDKCEIIDDCVEGGKYRYCRGYNGTCEYDIDLEIAVCTCPEKMSLNPVLNICQDCYCGKNSKKCEFSENGKMECTCESGYASKSNICTATCNQDEDCKNGGTCIIKGEDKFCECKEGTGGDKCEIIDDCTEKGKYKNCVGENGSCGYDVATGKAICSCPKGKKLNPVTNICEECKCGHKEQCQFLKDGSKACACLPGYAYKDYRCTATCNSDADCMYMGICEDKKDKFCKCRNGLSGDNCEVIDDCGENGKYKNCRGENGTCGYDLDDEQAVCRCSHGKQLNTVNNICQDCNCGEKGKCSFKDGSKVCECNLGTSERNGVCEVCDCGKGSTCKFILGAKACNCMAGYQYDDASEICKECNCGQHSESCSFRDGKKMCQCVQGYQLKEEYCAECDCGKDALSCSFVGSKKTCSCVDGYFEEDGKCQSTCIEISCFGGTCRRYGGIETCICPEGQALINGHCTASNCRPETCYGGRCEMVDGFLECVCPPGYHLEGIGCHGNLCKHTNCFGGTCTVYDDHEVCTCPDGYTLRNDVCELNLCEEKNCFGGKCSIIQGEEVCTCPKGFEIRGDVCELILNDECDIDE